MKVLPPAIILAMLALAGCQQQPAEKQAGPQAAATANGPDAKPGLALQAGRLVLPAVKGNPGAAYFMLDNASGKTAVLAALTIDGAAKAEMHRTEGSKMEGVERLEIAPGTSLAFEPGKLHVMVFGLDAKLQADGQTEMTLTFADGDKLSAPLKIEAPGGGMGHGDMH